MGYELFTICNNYGGEYCVQIECDEDTPVNKKIRLAFDAFRTDYGSFCSQMKNLNLSNGDFKGYNFSYLNLDNVDFTGANLYNANFEGACINYTVFKNASLIGTNFNRTCFDMNDKHFILNKLRDTHVDDEFIVNLLKKVLNTNFKNQFIRKYIIEAIKANNI